MTIQSMCPSVTATYLSPRASNKTDSERMLSAFLSLSGEEQAAYLQDSSKKEALEEIISTVNQTQVRNEENGDLLIHQLIRCSSAEGRALALLCLDNGAFIDAPNKHTVTPLLLAIVKGDDKLVESLLQRGADPTLAAGVRTPMDIAFQYNRNTCVALLAERIEPTEVLNAYLSSLGCSEEDLEKKMRLLDLWKEKGLLEGDLGDKLWMKLLGAINNSFSPAKPPLASKLFLYFIQSCIGTKKSEEVKQKVANQIFQTLIGTDKYGVEHLPFFETLQKANIPLTFDNYEWLDQFKDKVPYKDLAYQLLESQPEDRKEIFDLRIAIQNEDSLIKLSQLFEEYKEKIQRIHFDPQQMQQYISDVEETVNTHRIVMQEINNQECLSQFISGSAQKILMPKWVQMGRWDYLVKMIQTNDFRNVPHISTKILYGFSLDKLPLLSDPYDQAGFLSVIQARHLYLALEAIANNPTFEGADQPFNAFKPLLEEFVILNTLMDNQSCKRLAPAEERIFEKVKKLRVGEKILIPAGCLRHETALLIEKTDPTHFQMTYYNTGAGVTLYHYPGERINTFQTHEIVTDIPEASILNEANWKAFIQTKWAPTIKESYDCFYNILGKGGTRKACSSHPEDYEAKQLSGTCATQCLMAALRHQVMASVKGTMEEKKAFYKALKTEIISEIYRQHLPQTEGALQNHPYTITQKLKAESILLSIAQNPEEFEIGKEQLAACLIDAGLTKEASDLKSKTPSSDMGRYALLRESSKLLADYYLKNPQLLNEIALKNQPALSLVLARYEHRTSIMIRIRARLEAAANDPSSKEDLPMEMYAFLCHSSFTEETAKEIVRLIGNDPAPYERMEVLLKIMEKKYHKVLPERANKVISNLADLCNPNLKKWILEAWEAITKSPTEEAYVPADN